VAGELKNLSCSYRIDLTGGPKVSGQNVRSFFDRLWETAKVLETENEVWPGFSAQKTIQDRSQIYSEYTKRKSKHFSSK
jgi:hypothetical protein